MRKIKAGDTLEFVAISWDENHWEFDYPTVLLEPFIQYSPNGMPPETMIEDSAINTVVYEEIPEDEDISHEFNWRGWKLQTLKKVVKDRVDGKDTWKTKIREIVKQTVEFYDTDDEGLGFKVIKTEKY